MLPSDLLQAVADAIAEVQGVENVITYEPTDDGVNVVTVWVDLETLTQEQPWTEDSWDAEASYRIVVAVPHGSDTQITAWDLSYVIGSRLHSGTWLNTEPAQLISVSRDSLDDFGNDLDVCEVVVQQHVTLPTLITANAGDWQTNPSVAWASRSPDIGIPNIPKYKKVSEYP